MSNSKKKKSDHNLIADKRHLKSGFRGRFFVTKISVPDFHSRFSLQKNFTPNSDLKFSPQILTQILTQIPALIIFRIVVGGALSATCLILVYFVVCLRVCPDNCPSGNFEVGQAQQSKSANKSAQMRRPRNFANAKPVHGGKQNRDPDPNADHRKQAKPPVS